MHFFGLFLSFLMHLKLQQNNKKKTIKIRYFKILNKNTNKTVLFRNAPGLKRKKFGSFHKKFIHWFDKSAWFDLSKKPNPSHWTSGNRKLELPTELMSELNPESTPSKTSISLKSFMSSIFLLISSFERLGGREMGSAQLSNHSGSCLMHGSLDAAEACWLLKRFSTRSMGGRNELGGFVLGILSPVGDFFVKGLERVWYEKAQVKVSLV